jgi:Uma2 family endonuclease
MGASREYDPRMPVPDLILGGDMSAPPPWSLVSVEDYLAAELVSPIKHEYLGGAAYGMPTTRNRHNRIATNTLGALGVSLRGRRCQPFNSDTKIRIRLPTQTRFYYPDASVICEPNPDDDTFQDHPAVIAEVLSRSTRRIDEGEKKDAYLTIPSLNVYMLVEQDAPRVTVHRRTEAGFVREVYDGLDVVIPLSEIEIDLPLAEIYAGVEFAAEPGPDEDV